MAAGVRKVLVQRSFCRETFSTATFSVDQSIHTLCIQEFAVQLSALVPYDALVWHSERALFKVFSRKPIFSPIAERLGFSPDRAWVFWGQLVGGVPASKEEVPVMYVTMP